MLVAVLLLFEVPELPSYLEEEEDSNETEHKLYNTFGPTGRYGNFSFWRNSDIPILRNEEDPQQCYLGYSQKTLYKEIFNLPFVSPTATGPSARTISYGAEKAMAVANKPTYEDLESSGIRLNTSKADSTLKNACPQYTNQSCCLSQDRARELSSQIQITNLSSYKISNAKSTRRTQMYPKCDDLIRPFFCSVCHENIKYMSVITRIGADAGGNQVIEEFYNIRVCHSFAKKLYRDCRYAVFINSDDGWIVEPGMGYNDFLKKLQIDKLNNKTDDTEDKPGVNCWDYSAGFMSSAASYILVALVAVTSFAVAFI